MLYKLFRNTPSIWAETMASYKLCEITKGNYIKVLKCLANTSNTSPRKTLFVIIPGKTFFRTTSFYIIKVIFLNGSWLKTGNPGIVEFYEHMAVELCSLTNCSVIAISHTGHLFDGTLKSNWNHRHNVKEQINHKIQYLEKHLFQDQELAALSYNEANTDIVFIGHSIGCFIILEILEVMRKNLKNQVKKAILLFPTIERMSVTPNGKVLTFMTSFFMWLIYFFAYLITLMPTFVHKLGIDFLFTRQHAKKQLVKNASQTVNGMLTNFSCVRSCLFMGRDEMGHVKKLNTKIIERHLHLLLFYYGRTDKWCPLDYYYDMQSYMNKLNNSNYSNPKMPTLVLDNHGMDHAFCLYQDQCSIISSMIKQWIEPVEYR